MARTPSNTARAILDELPSGSRREFVNDEVRNSFERIRAQTHRFTDQVNVILNEIAQSAIPSTETLSLRMLTENGVIDATRELLNQRTLLRGAPESVLTSNPALRVLLRSVVQGVTRVIYSPLNRTIFNSASFRLRETISRDISEFVIAKIANVKRFLEVFATGMEARLDSLSKLLIVQTSLMCVGNFLGFLLDNILFHYLVVPEKFSAEDYWSFSI